MIKKIDKKDPHFSREAEIYQDPIASREFLLKLIEDLGGNIKFHDIAQALDYQDSIPLDALRRRLRAMVRDGQLGLSGEGEYHLVDSEKLQVGEIIINKDGFAKVLIEGESIPVPPRYLNQLFPGDLAKVRITGPDRRGQVEAVIVEVLERRTKTIVGRIYSDEDGCFVVPEDGRVTHDILVMPADILDAQDEQLVLVEITQYPDRYHPATGRVISVLGDSLTAPLIIDEAISTFQIPNEWSRAVVSELRNIPEEVHEKELFGRKDLRDLPFVTIDGEDAKDFDDAVYCEPQGKNWRLLVAIADVSHYVKHHSALDKEAEHRGNSVYFPGRVVPMQPEKISNGLCSLNPHVDRLVMVADMIISPKGERQSYEFYPAVFRSQGRLTYN